MKRRDFLRNTSMAGLAALPHFMPGFGSGLFNVSPWARILKTTANLHDRVLVLVRLDGGNDGLNTVVPIDQYEKLAEARPQVILPESEILPLSGYDSLGLHPAMAGLQSLFQQEKLKIIQSVGYPNQDYSHFRSSDIWMTGADADEVLSTGWAGRYLHYEYPNFPAEYPNDEMPDPLALEIGATLSLTVQGPISTMGMSVFDPAAFYELISGIDAPVPNTPAGEQLAYIRTVARQSNLYGDVVTEAYEAGANLAYYPDNNELAEQLRIVARLISGGLKTPLYLVSISGFDTHDNQVDSSGHSQGQHANLLRQLSDAISAFQRDIDQLGHADRVLGMTFSEFGRRIIANNSNGTDHGAAAPLFVFGQNVSGGVLGDNPYIPSEVFGGDNLPMQYDFRSVYATMLKDWFCVPESDIESILFSDFQALPILDVMDCIPTASRERHQSAGLQLLAAWPNPFTEKTTVSFSGQGRVLLQVFNGSGKLAATLANRYFPKGEHRLDWDATGLPSGNYYIRIQLGAFQQVKTVIKVR
ncbi:MAG: DUF1501 domain-containing protein [Phaeodactylibacter sp.]|nr:DUF1501 domain-containing protein [Phaeodactylibacter sp.]MCB9275909.1 DUF1501 domain-containing protein [Lewinellaceae bacterium]